MVEKPMVAQASKWLEDHGDALFAYALSRLRDRQLAEEAVQETFLAALKRIAQYRQDGSEGAWLTGILKRKVIDQMRALAKQPASLDSDEAALAELFDKRGLWTKASKSRYSVRLDSLEQEEFNRIFELCLQKLPPSQARVFWLKEVQEENSSEVCKVLEITASNLWVLMHRARLGLAECIKLRWAMEKN